MTAARASGSSTLQLAERDARSVLLVWAIEESDREGAVLSATARQAATERAVSDSVGADSPSDGAVTPARVEAIAVARARRLSEEVVRDHPGLGRLLTPMPAGTVAAVAVGIGFVAGLVTNAWGPERRVSLLAFPIGAIVLWNLGAFAAMTVAAAARRLSRRGSPLGATPGLGRRLVELGQSTIARRVGADAGSAALAAALVRFRGAWFAAALPLSVARVRLALHLGAVSVALGAVVGMYAAGIALEYRATWESTWLDAAAVQRYVDFVLAPSSRLLGVSVPDVAPLEAPHGSGPAGVWIHLWATTVGLLVVAPRLALAAIELVRGARLSNRVPVEVDARRLRRALAARSGSVVRVETVFYSCSVEGTVRERLSVLLVDLLGARARFGDTLRVDYGSPGDDVPLPTDDASAESVVVVVFPAAQTPEIEVHGEFLERLSERTRDAGCGLVAVLETSSYLHHVGSDERVGERCATWGRLFRALDMDAAADAVADGGFRAWVASADPDSERAPRRSTT